MEDDNKLRGARIIVENWMNVKAGESVLIITDETHMADMQLVSQYAEHIGALTYIELIPRQGFSLNTFMDSITEVMSKYSVIIGATHYSLVTTEVVRKAVKSGARFLSLPMSTNNGYSLLAYDFLTMDTTISRIVARELLKHINQSSRIRVTTEAGTDITFRKVGREGNYFNGKAKDSKGFASSSFEVYVPIEEDQTNGVGVLDGSLGYLGKMKKPFNISFAEGKISDIESTPCGQRLSKYIESFDDPRMYHATELGIGTNFYSRCDGNSYIEDESAYGTFHIGFGCNIALGGAFDAKGHFDVVFLKPTVYADNRMIMENGIIIPAIPEVW